MIEPDLPPPGGGKPSSGRVIRIVNNLDHTIQVKVFLFSKKFNSFSPFIAVFLMHFIFHSCFSPNCCL